MVWVKRDEETELLLRLKLKKQRMPTEDLKKEAKVVVKS